MKTLAQTVLSFIFCFFFLMACICPADAQSSIPLNVKNSIAKLKKELVSKYGEQQRARVKRGMQQVSRFWRVEDGDTSSFEEFVRTNFAGKQETLDTMFSRFQFLFEQLDGHMNEVVLALRAQSDLDRGPILPFDEVFGGYDPSAHVIDDFFKNKIAFIVLLNFPLTTLEERLTTREKLTRRQWAEIRLAQRYESRIPADVALAVAQASAEAEQYIAEYNIWMHHIVNEKGERLFPQKMRLLSHWNLRDEIKALYSDKNTGIVKQRIIQQVMERIVTQTIPKAVINNPTVDWNPNTNQVAASDIKDFDVSLPVDKNLTNAPEPDTRYATLLKTFIASRKEDPYWPTVPTLIARQFDVNREIPEDSVRALFQKILTSPLVSQVVKLIESRLSRPLEPFDIWYNGFRPRSTYTEAQLDAIVSKKYPTAHAFEKDIPEILMKLGFTKTRAEYIADLILVDPARGSGHAWGAQMRSGKALLRTRIGEHGMDYKGYNIALHELGHCVEQTISLNDIDFTLLAGVPNTAFTEALAFVFQGHDLELLGLAPAGGQTEAFKALNDFWATCEIAGVALVDMEVWHWMYAHPTATPADLKEAVLVISRNIWNDYYAPLFKKKDVVLLGVYSHMINSFLYLPDYPIGHVIAAQIEEQMKKAKAIGPEFERIAVQGRILPDLWMKNATGAPVSPQALLTGTKKALKELEARK